jgi:tRNA pseudouridine synthase 9
MALVSEARAACPAPVAADEPNEKTTPEEVAHDACGGVDEHGRPWPAPYYLHDGLRRVPPYHFTYNTWVKGRWRNRGILDVFTSEFRDRTEEYYVRRPLLRK